MKIVLLVDFFIYLPKLNKIFYKHIQTNRYLTKYQSHSDEKKK